MAVRDGLLMADLGTTYFGGKSAAPRTGLALDGASGPTTTYCYRESGGTRGTTTDLGSVPAGAEIERTVTT